MDALFSSCEQGDVETLSSCLSRKNTLEKINTPNKNGLFPIHYAAITGVKEVVALLIKHGANVNVQDTNGWTPLHYAVAYYRLPIVLLLLENGGDPNIVDLSCLSPFDVLQDRKMFKKSFSKPICELQTWGGGANCALGHGTMDSKASPKKVRAVSGKDITGVACSKFHTVIATTTGEVYTWGFGRGGRLGHGDEEPKLLPLKISALNGIRVVFVACSLVHTAFVTREGKMYTCGENKDGQLGIGEMSVARTTPQHVSFPQIPSMNSKSNGFIVGAALGPTHTVAVTSNGRCWSWGCGTEGQLGLGGENKTSYSEPHMIPLFAGSNVQAVAVAANQSYTLVLANKYSFIYLFGKGRVHEVKVALKLPKGARVVGLFAAPERAICVSSTGEIIWWQVQMTSKQNLDVPIPCNIANIGGHKVVCAATTESRIIFSTDHGAVWEWLYPTPSNLNPKVTRVPIQRAIHVSLTDTHFLAVAGSANKPLPKPEPPCKLDFTSALGIQEFSDMSFLLSSGEAVPAHRIFASRCKEWVGLKEGAVVKTNLTKDELLKLLRSLYTDIEQVNEGNPNRRQSKAVNRISLQEHLASFVNSRKFSDFTLKAEEAGTVLRVHRIVLSTRCEFFRVMLLSGMRETRLGEATLSLPDEILDRVVRYLYTDTIGGDKLDSTSDSAMPVVINRLNLLLAADQLMLPQLKVQATNFVETSLSIDNAIAVAEFAENFSATNLLGCCLRFIASNLDIFLESGTLHQLPEPMLIQLSSMLSQNGNNRRNIPLSPNINSQTEMAEPLDTPPKDPAKKIKGLRKKILKIIKLEKKFEDGEDLNESENAKLRNKETVLAQLELLGVSRDNAIATAISAMDDSMEEIQEPDPVEDFLDDPLEEPDPADDVESDSVFDSIDVIELDSGSPRDLIFEPEASPPASAVVIPAKTTPSKKRIYKKIVGFDPVLIAEALQRPTPPVAVSPPSPKIPFSWGIGKQTKPIAILDIQKEQISTAIPTTQVRPSKSTPSSPAHTPSTRLSASVPMECFITEIKKKEPQKKKKVVEVVEDVAVIPPPKLPWGMAQGTRTPAPSFADILAEEEEAAKPRRFMSPRNISPLASQPISFITSFPSQTWSSKLMAQSPPNANTTTSVSNAKKAVELRERNKKNEDVITPKSLAKIQTEEEAMKQIAQLYSLAGIKVSMRLATSI